MTVLYDACVLYPQTLRDLLMHLATTDLVRAKWSKDIHDEWIRNVHKNKPDISLEKLQRVRELMDSHVLDALVSGYEPLIEGLSLPDSGDRHVLAAAIVGRADAIITLNLKHFPASSLAPFHLDALHPDDLIFSLLDFAPSVVCQCVKRQREMLKKPPRTVEEHLKRLATILLPKTVARLSEYPEWI